LHRRFVAGSAALWDPTLSQEEAMDLLQQLVDAQLLVVVKAETENESDSRT
jgi:23S rRNA A2030 N6-methylase RlmJ